MLAGLIYSLTLMMEAVPFSETPVEVHRVMWHHMSEDSALNFSYCHESYQIS
jgi:hypothetical protein